MDTETQIRLTELIKTGAYAALGTLREGAPFVSMVLYAASSDLRGYYVHISGLAIHTQNILVDPQASLMILDSVQEGKSLQTIGRVSIQGRMQQLKQEGNPYRRAESVYLKKYPEARGNFALADFGLFEFRPDRARFVAGLGRIFDLESEDFGRLAAGGG